MQRYSEIWMYVSYIDLKDNECYFIGGNVDTTYCKNLSGDVRLEGCTIMKKKEVLEMRGMKRKEIIDYFLSIEGITHNDSTFYGENYKIIVDDESNAVIGSLSIPSTIVTFIGREECLEKVIYRFRLKFLKAGG